MDLGWLMVRSGMSFRTYRVGDEAAILRLLEKTPGVGCSLERWAWLFPVEVEGRLIVVGESEGEIASVCAGTPARVVVDDREWEAVQLRQVATSGSADPGVVVEEFVGTFGSNHRLAVLTAVPAPDGECPPGFTAADSGRMSVLVRHQPEATSLSRLFYRAERARDWEPRLDGLWQRARGSYPVAVVRDAERALRRFAAHPSTPHHRFLVFPRFSSRAVAYAVFAVEDDTCRWVDLVWDHRHPGAVELLARISGRLVAQLGAGGEEVSLAGDDTACMLLKRRGFVVAASSARAIAARSLAPGLDAASFVDRCYLTLSDVGGARS